MPGADRGRVTVGVTEAGASALVRIMETGFFGTEMDAYKVAVALALRAGVRADESVTGVTTKWNIGSLDPDGLLADLVDVLDRGGTGDPIDRAQRLADIGLSMLVTRLVDSGQTLSEALDIGEHQL